jgi:RNA polymerase sigma-70 factor (ECF subfamily)
VAWTLRHVEGESLEEVAVLCDCSLATAKRRIASAHEKIKQRLEGRRK